MSIRRLSPAPPPATLVELLEARAEAAPETTAYIYLRNGRTEELRLSYLELERRARALAAHIQAAGVARGERALLVFPAGIEVLVALFGCQYAGVIAIPVPAPEASRIARTLPRLTAIAEDAGATLLISSTPVLEGIATLPRAETALAALRQVDVASVDPAHASQWRRPAIDGDSLAYLQYTSGSTSAPKGVCIAQRHLLSHLEILSRHSTGYALESITVNWMPYFHDYGLVEGMLVPLFNQTTCVLLSPYALIKQPANWLRAISHYRATHSQAPNFAYALCVRRADPAIIAELDLSHWRCAGNAAEPINSEVMTAFARTFAPAGFRYDSFSPAYGLAEATLMVSYKMPGRGPRVVDFDRAALEQGWVSAAPAGAPPQATTSIVSCGHILEQTEAVIVDPETRKRLPAAQVGEIWVASDGVAGGYWRRQRSTEEIFHAYLAETGEGPFLRTGDLGFLLDEELFVCGRLKDLIIIHGQNYIPQDIEWAVQSAHDALRPESGAAFSVPVDGQERLVIVHEVYGKAVRALDQSAVFAAMHSAVGEALGLEIQAIALVRPGAVPKTSSGKIQHSACRRMFLDGTLKSVAAWRRALDTQPAGRPDSEPSQAAIRDFVVARVAASVGLGIAEIDPHEPFARFGMDSVRVVSLVGEIEAWLGRELAATLAFDYPNAVALARHLGTGQDRDVAAVALPGNGPQPIAIVGIGCRLPGGINDAGQFWEALRAGFDGISEVPAERWENDTWYSPQPATPGKMNTRWGGFIDDIDAFDAGFFALSPREARCVDPQQRILLEVSWEALEHAGIAADGLAGSRTGVFVGICNNDYQRLQGVNGGLQQGYAATGNAFSIAANRISYTLDLLGPSLAVDTACSSSLVAVHQACRSLRLGEADLALAGGVNLVLDPAATVAFSQTRMMSPSGRCRTFSDDADGYVRGEGCAMVVLRRLADAERAGDHIIAVIRGSAVNQDGRSNGLTAPSGPSQQAVLRAALTDAGVVPAEVGYIEAHGTGTPLGDPIELNALAKVLGEGRTSAQRCWVGSVKSNIGHLEAAAGIAGLIKAALCVERGEIPGNLHFRSLNPHIEIDGSVLGVPVSTAPWPGEGKARIAGVSSFGFGGTNAHAIVAAPPESAGPLTSTERPCHLLCASARSREALTELVGAYVQRLRSVPDDRLGDLCFTINAGRSVFAYRAAVFGASGTELAEALERWMGDGSPTGPGVAYGKAVPVAPPLVYLFADVPAADPGMGAELYRTSAVFAHAVERCLRRLGEAAGETLRRCFTGTPSESSVVAHELSRVHSFVLQYAAWELWRSWGVGAAEICGAGRGLFAAACAAGVVTLDEALHLCTAGDREDAGDRLAAMPLCAPEIPLIAMPCATDTALATVLAQRLHGLGARQEPLADAPLWLEIGPRDVNAVRGSVPGASLLPGFEAGRGEWRALLSALGRLFTTGVAADWTRFDAPYGRRRIEAPGYPFQRRRYWFSPARESAVIATRVTSDTQPPATLRETSKGNAIPAFGTPAHLDWLLGELGRLRPAERRSVLQRLMNEAREDLAQGTGNGEASLSSTEIQGLSDEEAEVVLRRRLESMHY